MAYYPLWRASAGGAALPVTPDRYALQQVSLPAGGPYRVTLAYADGWPEWLGALLSAAGGLLALLALLYSFHDQ